MKNVHILPTDKPSNLLFEKISNRYYTNSRRKENSKNVQNQNIYITSDEEIKEGDWFYDLDTEYLRVKQSWENSHLGFNGKKIILTTDRELNKAGVWGIEDGFLEWFVKNPTCEYVELKGYAIILPGESCDCDSMCGECEAKQEWPESTGDIFSDYTIGKSKAIQNSMHLDAEIACRSMYKQETLEEAKNRILQENLFSLNDADIFELGAKWQQERMYSDEEVEDLIYKVCGTVARLQGITLNGNHIDTAYKQFKKK